MTPAQLTALKADINGGALSSQPNNSDGDIVVAAAYNTPDASYTVWRPDIRSSEVVAAIVGSEYVALTAVKQNALLLLITPGVVDASSANVRADFASIFTSGTSLTNLTALSKRLATRVEKLFATGAGTNGSPSIMAVQGPITPSDIRNARSS